MAATPVGSSDTLMAPTDRQRIADEPSAITTNKAYPQEVPVPQDQLQRPPSSQLRVVETEIGEDRRSQQLVAVDEAAGRAARPRRDLGRLDRHVVVGELFAREVDLDAARQTVPVEHALRLAVREPQAGHQQLAAEELLHHQRGDATLTARRFAEAPEVLVHGVAGLQAPVATEGRLDRREVTVIHRLDDTRRDAAASP